MIDLPLLETFESAYTLATSVMPDAITKYSQATAFGLASASALTVTLGIPKLASSILSYIDKKKPSLHKKIREDVLPVVDKASFALYISSAVVIGSLCVTYVTGNLPSLEESLSAHSVYTAGVLGLTSGYIFGLGPSLLK